MNLADSFFCSCLAFTSLASFAAPASADAPAETGGVLVNVGPLRNARGSIACRLYKSAEGFPRTSNGTLTQRAKVAGTTARCTFDKLPPGTYAVMVHHDENDNGKFDTNVLGLPLEGYGASNNHLPTLSAPRWEASKFAVERGKSRELAISVRY